MHVNGETQAVLIYDSSFMSQTAATSVTKVRVRDLKIVPYHVRGKGSFEDGNSGVPLQLIQRPWQTGMQAHA